MTTSLTTKDFFSQSDLSPDEFVTAKQEFDIIQPCLERKANNTKDNVLIAGSLCRMRDKHGRNSKLYISFISSLSEYDESWSDKDFRLKWVEAYRGYEALPGCDSDKEFIWKMRPSASALAAVRYLPSAGNRAFSVLKDLKDQESFPSAAALDRYGKSGKFLPAAAVSKTEPAQPYQQTYTPQPYTVDVPASSTHEERSSIDSPEEMLSAHVESGVAVLDTAPASSDVQTAVTVPDIALACQADALVKTVRQFMDEYYSSPPEERRLCDQPLKQVATLLERVLA